jgi:hypothetical protein
MFGKKKTKIEIKSIFGNVLFTHECEDNTIAKTVEEAVRSYADLSYADLSYANLRSADLSSANLRSADLSYANLRSADLSSANLRSADLSSANLSYANLRSADLSYADLSYANLRSANLSSANLSYADLSYSKTDKRYIQIGSIGSSKRLTTYCFEDDQITCGCFTGTLKEFQAECKKTHKDNKQYLNEYLGAIKYIKSLIKDTPKPQA